MNIAADRASLAGPTALFVIVLLLVLVIGTVLFTAESAAIGIAIGYGVRRCTRRFWGILQSGRSLVTIQRLPVRDLIAAPRSLLVPEIVMLPGGVSFGGRCIRFASMKIKLSGGGDHVSAVFAPGVSLTLIMFKLYNIPEPASGVKSWENADTRRTLIEPVPITLPETFQLVAVIPAGETTGS